MIKLLAEVSFTATKENKVEGRHKWETKSTHYHKTEGYYHKLRLQNEK